MIEKIHFFFLQMWEKTRRQGGLSFGKKFVFLVLSFFEYFYILFFKIIIYIKKRCGGYSLFPFFVISVGNLSVGGTGKSVFVRYFLDKFLPLQGAIFVRGYKKRKKGKSIIVFPKDSVKNVGDEALMLAKNTSALVVSGKNRVASGKKLMSFSSRFKKHIDYILLDDAYQNFQLKKDLEVLLLDARKPFENNHCLPAGPLREKDYSRANMIIFTHADEVPHSLLERIITERLSSFPKTRIFMGKHVFSSLVDCEGAPVVLEGEMLALAGIGSFSGFVSSIKSAGIVITKKLEYPDHFEYAKKDILYIIETMKKNNCHGIITTEKDWQKLEPLVGGYKHYFFILKIVFQFLSSNEEKKFVQLTKKILHWS